MHKKGKYENSDYGLNLDGDFDSHRENAKACGDFRDYFVKSGKLTAFGQKQAFYVCIITMYFE